MKKLFYLIVVTIYAVPAAAQFKYPATKQVIATNTYFGVTYKDPYQWMEDFKDTSVVSWFKQQANLTNVTLNKLNGRDELINEWKALDKLQPPRINGRKYQNGKMFYRKTLPGEKIGKIYYRIGLTGQERLLFNPATYIKGKNLTVEGFIPSYDAKKLAIAYSEEGAEVSTIKIMDIATAKFLNDAIYPVAGLGSWSFDNQAIFYYALKSANNADPEQRLNIKYKMHKLGTQADVDNDFFSNASYPELKISPANYPSVNLTEDNKRYMFASESSVQAEFKMYYAPIEQFNSKIQWKVLCTTDDNLVRGMEFVGDKVFAISHDNALNYKLLQTDLKNVNWKTAKVIAAEKKDQTLEAIVRAKDFLLLAYSDGINSHIYKYNIVTGVTTPVKTPFSGTIGAFCINNKTNIFTVGITSWTQPYTEFDYNAVTNTFSPGLFNKAPVYPAAYKNLLVKEVEVKGHDGVMVPLSIIYKKGTVLNGNNVCLMDSYGAYGSSMTPAFDQLEGALAIRGVVIAIPHVRGGSEKGEAWYRAGFKVTKPNTWKDFISCAEYLIAQGYTKPSKLAGTGTSAGGILITRSITERPDLFAAAICNVGCANAMRLEFSSNGPVNIPEFGTVKDSVECRALYEMDGLQHVVAGTKYPALLCVAGWNDSRVIAWQPGKFAGAVQNASTSGKPVLMKVNYDNGHFTQDKNVTFANFADQIAFAMWQCGHPDFQPKKLQL